MANLSSTLVTPWTIARQAPLSLGFSRQGCWSGLPFPPQSLDLPNPGIEPGSPVLQADSLPFEPLGFMYYLGSHQSLAFALGGALGKSHSPSISCFPAANGTDNNDACLIELLWGLSR